MIDSRDIKELHPCLERGANEFLRRCKAKGLNVLITQTYRDIEYQNKLYAQGRTTSGNIVTNAKGGQSFHNFRLAFDFCKNIKGQEYSDANFFTACGAIWSEMGGVWGGDWTDFVDRPHCEFSDGYSLKSIVSMNGKLPDNTVMKWEVTDNNASIRFNNTDNEIKSILKDDFNYFSEESVKKLIQSPNLSNSDSIIYQRKKYYKLRDISAKNNINIYYVEDKNLVIMDEIQ